MKNPIRYKTIELNVDQLAISATALELLIADESRSIKKNTEKLNGANSTEQARELQDEIKKSRNRIQNLKPIIEQMFDNERWVIKHTL
jgi:predicted  nucleic acid-binding Zn-ribbon protein